MFFEDFEDANTDATDNPLPADSGWYINEPYGDTTYYDSGGGLTSEYTYSTYYNAPIEGSHSAMLSLSRFDEPDRVYMDVSFLDIDYEDPLTLSFLWDIYASGSLFEAFILVSYDGGESWTTLNDGNSLAMDYVLGNSATHTEQLPTWTTAPDNVTLRFE